MPSTNRYSRLAALCALAVAPCLLTGCSLVVMAGKMLFGDPVVTCAFKAQTNVDLTRDAVKVLIVSTAPELLKSSHSALDMEMIEGVTRRLRVQQVRVVNPDKVTKWLDDNGGTFDHPGELAEHFNTDFIIHINVEKCTFTEENTPNLYHGHATGSVMAYKVEKVNGVKTARNVFERGFTVEHPTYPISADNITAKVFETKFINRVCAEISWMFFDHRMTEEVE
ncbi:MAG: hypothetical protein IT428_03445 [Planctomycetaceae bacterium]|nr:hypothetical protein [Planctomycetaceae bacterium]